MNQVVFVMLWATAELIIIIMVSILVTVAKQIAHIAHLRQFAQVVKVLTH